MLPTAEPWPRTIHSNDELPKIRIVSVDDVNGAVRAINFRQTYDKEEKKMGKTAAPIDTIDTTNRRKKKREKENVIVYKTSKNEEPKGGGKKTLNKLLGRL